MTSALRDECPRHNPAVERIIRGCDHKVMHIKQWSEYTLESGEQDEGFALLYISDVGDVRHLSAVCHVLTQHGRRYESHQSIRRRCRLRTSSDRKGRHTVLELQEQLMESLAIERQKLSSRKTFPRAFRPTPARLSGITRRTTIQRRFDLGR